MDNKIIIQMHSNVNKSFHFSSNNKCIECQWVVKNLMKTWFMLG